MMVVTKVVQNPTLMDLWRQYRDLLVGGENPLSKFTHIYINFQGKEILAEITFVSGPDDNIPQEGQIRLKLSNQKLKDSDTDTWKTIARGEQTSFELITIPLVPTPVKKEVGGGVFLFGKQSSRKQFLLLPCHHNMLKS